MIPDIVDFVQDLIAKGYAYAVDGDVYYRARKFKHYGELSHQNVDELEEGASQHITQEELDKKEIQSILPCGKLLNPVKSVGTHHG